MMQPLKDWLIRKLGGYTYTNMHYASTQWMMAELRNSVYLRNLSQAQYDEAEALVRKEIHNEVHSCFKLFWGYRGNKPRKPY